MIQFLLFNITVENGIELLTARKSAWLIRHELSTLYGNKFRSDTGVTQAYIQVI